MKEIEKKAILENLDFFKSSGITVPKGIEAIKKLKEKGIEIELTDLI